MKTLLVDCSPKDMRGQNAVNLGYEIVSNKLDADRCRFYQKVDNISQYSKIAFNVFFPTHVFNAISFMHRNNIEPLLIKRNFPDIVFGGQGVWANPELVGKIADYVFMGEADGECTDSNKVHRAINIITEPVIKNRVATIEVARGCQYHCPFCEYGCFSGGKYRSKPLSLIKEQIDYVKKKGAKDLNLLASNLSSYKEIDELLGYVQSKNMGVVNFGVDLYVTDVKRMAKWLPIFSTSQVKLAVESFDEVTRYRVGKKYSDEQIMEAVEILIKNGIHNVNFLLIWGLPKDNYSRWTKWLEELSVLRNEYSRTQPNLFGETVKFNQFPLRFETTIQNFEPCRGTPLENAVVDIDSKEDFLKSWMRGLKLYGFISPDASETYGLRRGRIGRKPLSYKLTMMLRKGGSELTDALINSFPKGIGRSISDKEVMKFMEIANV
jgi:hypothetical protein